KGDASHRRQSICFAADLALWTEWRGQIFCVASGRGQRVESPSKLERRGTDRLEECSARSNEVVAVSSLWCGSRGRKPWSGRTVAAPGRANGQPLDDHPRSVRRIFPLSSRRGRIHAAVLESRDAAWSACQLSHFDPRRCPGKTGSL